MTDDTSSSSRNNTDRLLAIMARLRDPVDGCPWDVEQTFATIAPHTIEEAYEVAEAVEQNDMAALKDELGDLLLQVVFQARIAEELGEFDFCDVVDAIADKLIRRHPHVFGDVQVADADQQTEHWEALKAQERHAKAQGSGKPRASVLDDVATALPAMTRAIKLQKRASRVGFDWPDLDPVIDKIEEELEELRAEIHAQSEEHRILDEMGDLLFVCVNLARKLGVDPETALRHTNAKFTRRFHFIENRLAASGRRPEDSDLAEMDRLWTEAKLESPPSRR